MVSTWPRGATARVSPAATNSQVPPVVVAGSLAALELVKAGGAERQRLGDNAETLRRSMIEGGFDLLPGEHPIIAVLFDDAVADRMSEALFARGVYAVAFTHPVVPRGAARIRLQVSAAHSDAEIARCRSIR